MQKANSATASFSHQAAQVSWVCPLIIFGLLKVAQGIGSIVILELISLLLLVTGLALGIVALFGIRKHGTSGILGPAFVGIIINALLLAIFVTNFSAARARTLQRRNAGSSATPINPAPR